jgi:hypothetical protein
MDQRRTTHPALAEEESVKPFSITQALTSAMGAVLFGSEEASSSRVEPGAPGVLSAAHVSRGLKGPAPKRDGLSHTEAAVRPAALVSFKPRQ